MECSCGCSYEGPSEASRGEEGGLGGLAPQERRLIRRPEGPAPGEQKRQSTKTEIGPKCTIKVYLVLSDCGSRGGEFFRLTESSAYDEDSESMSAIPKSGLRRQLIRLNSIAGGPGAVKVAANVALVELLFRKGAKNQRGAKLFWRHHLPSVQFHNPALGIAVHKFDDDKHAFLQVKLGMLQ